MILEIAAQAVQSPPRRVHVFRSLGIIKCEQLQSKFGCMFRLNAGFRSRLKELFQATMPKAPDYYV
jgi:hypothetical protein